MQNAIVINGRLIGPTSVELDEPVANLTGEVEVILRPRANSKSDKTQSIGEFLRQLPPGIRSREDIDEQIRQERAGWEGKD